MIGRVQRYGIYFDAGLRQWYLHDSVHNCGVLLSDERKAQYDKIMHDYNARQKFLSRKYQELPTRKPK